MDKFWIGTGWKMNMTAAEARAYVAQLLALAPPSRDDVAVFVIPPYTALAAAREAIGDALLLLGRCHGNLNLRREVRKPRLGLMLPSRLATSGTLRL